MLRRSNTGWMVACFRLPAGGLEKGETLSTAAVRELKEETGVNAIPSALAFAHTMHVWTQNHSWIGHYFICREWSDVPFLSKPDKHTELSWKNMSDLPVRTIPYVRQAVEAINADECYSEYGWDTGR